MEGGATTLEPFATRGAAAGARHDALFVYTDAVARQSTALTRHSTSSPPHRYPSPHENYGEPPPAYSVSLVCMPWPPLYSPHLGGSRWSLWPSPSTTHAHELNGHSAVMSSHLGSGMPALAHFTHRARRGQTLPR